METKLFQGGKQYFSRDFAGECGKLLTVFPSPVMVYVVETATQELHEVRTRCLTPCEVQKPAQSTRHFRSLRGNKGSTDHTYIGLHGLHADIVSGLNRREWALREACLRAIE